MPSWMELLKEADPAAHVVQLYGQDRQLLTRNVRRYLVEGLQRGDGLLVIATAEHSYAFAQALSDDAAYQAAVREGRLVFLDAEITLARFMVDGQPDWDLFERTVGGIAQDVRSRASTGGLRAYGEMVGLLWKAGQIAAAVRLEEYWSRLLAASSFSLFCAYPIAHDGATRTDELDAILAAHTHCLPATDDLLTEAVG